MVTARLWTQKCTEAGETDEALITAKTKNTKTKKERKKIFCIAQYAVFLLPSEYKLTGLSAKH